jgi:cytidylate kinase
MLAQRLGYTFFDSDNIQKVAEKLGESAKWMETVEKESGGKIQKFFAGIFAKRVDRILDDKQENIDSIRLDVVFKVVEKIAEEDNAIILGRGGQYILQQRKDTYHLLLVAEMNDRVKYAQDYYKLTESDAVSMIELKDRRRENLFRKIGRQNYEKASLYHLILNMSKLNIAKAADIVCKMIE